MMEKRDLIILVADLDMENSIVSLIGKRQESLGIRPISFDIRRHSMRDSGCFREADLFLQLYLRTHQYALVLFDHHGCGKEDIDPTRIEEIVEEKLAVKGWIPGRASCVVIDPELEVWFWANSPQVAESLGFGSDLDRVRSCLLERGLLSEGQDKPTDPKSAVESCLRLAKRPRSPRIFSGLAEKVSFGGCTDRSFRKFSQTLREWFPSVR